MSDSAIQETARDRVLAMLDSGDDTIPDLDGAPKEGELIPRDAPASGGESADNPPADAAQADIPSSADAEPAAPHAPVGYLPPDLSAETARIAAIDAEIAALDEKLSTGDIELEEWTKAAGSLQREAGALTARIEFANMRAQEEYQGAVSRFWADPSNKAFGENEALFASLDSVVRRLQSDPQTMARGHDWVFSEAKRQTLDAYAQYFGKPSADAPEKPDPKTDIRAKVEAAKPSKPMSLSDIPGGTAPPTDPFSAVDGKAPIDQVDAVMQMTPDQRNAWLDRRI